MTIPAHLESMSIDQLDLSAPVASTLVQRGIRTAAELFRHSPEDLLQDVGSEGVVEIDHAMNLVTAR